LKGRRNSLIAREGIPLLSTFAAATGLSWYYIGWIVALLPAAILVFLVFLFQDPRRSISSHPLAVVSPVDGTVIDVGTVDESIDRSAHKITIRINAFGTYTARSPIEGKLLDFHSEAGNNRSDTHVPGLWIRTDEGDDVVLQFHGYRFGLVPKAFSRYGERVGQGQRCAYLRLARIAEVFVPGNSRVSIRPGAEVVAGRDVLGTLPHPKLS
jgi:phosphatidylserine decarboxylase